MSNRNLSEDVMLVELPSEGLEITEELITVNETVSENCDCDVIIDFSKVEILNSSNISNLLILRRMLQEHRHQLIFCSVAVVTKCIFTVAGLDEIFVFADDKDSALAVVQTMN